MSKFEKYSGDVVALTVIDAETLKNDQIATNTKILIGARRRETNLTHESVVSVPTQRIPATLANVIPEIEKKLHEPKKYVRFSNDWVSNKPKNSHDPFVYMVENLMSRKLGVADHLESENITFKAKPEVGLLDWAKYPNLEGVTDAPYPEKELLRMINIRVHILDGANLFPEKTSSYDPLLWVSAENFHKMMPGKDLSHVGLGHRGFEFCVDGLCVSTTDEIIGSELTQPQPE